jgi:hypothetical protein
VGSRRPTPCEKTTAREAMPTEAASSGNECGRSNLIAHRMPTPPAHPMNDGLSLYPQAGAVSCLGTTRDPSIVLSVGISRQTKHEIWILAIGTIMIEAPFVAIAALAFAATKLRRPGAVLHQNINPARNCIVGDKTL